MIEPMRPPFEAGRIMGQLPDQPAGGWWHACPVPNEVSAGVFLHSWCAAGLSGYYFILALAKTTDKSGQAMIPGRRPRRKEGQPGHWQ